jgi:predicted deacylase
MDSETLIWSHIDYERDGRQVDYLHYPHSVTRSAYGTIAIPIAVFKNGRGPTVLLMAGNHGDEYEGQIVLTRLIGTLDPGRIQGRVIVTPAINLPAAMAGTRVSPIDGGNFNRAFPGDPLGGPTAAIAHYVDTVLYPMTDFMHDLHSGGSSLGYLPFCSMRLSGDAALDRKAMAALRAFGAPLDLVWAFQPDPRFSSEAAIRRGVVSLGGEFGGAGAVSIANLRLVERGVNNLLIHAGVIEGTVETPAEAPRLIQVRGRDHYVYAPEPGLFEPFAELGATVAAGQPCGQVVFPDNPARAPVPCHFRRAGLLVCKRHPGRVERGDCVAHLASDWQPPA